MNDLKACPILVLDEHKLAGKGIGMNAINVSPAQHDIIRRCVEANYMPSLAYKLRTDCHAFFQGGSHDREGGWVYLEFWCDDLTKINRFIGYLNYMLGTEQFNIDQGI